MIKLADYLPSVQRCNEFDSGLYDCWVPNMGFLELHEYRVNPIFVENALRWWIDSWLLKVNFATGAVTETADFKAKGTRVDFDPNWPIIWTPWQSGELELGKLEERSTYYSVSPLDDDPRPADTWGYQKIALITGSHCLKLESGLVFDDAIELWFSQSWDGGWVDAYYWFARDEHGGMGMVQMEGDTSKGRHFKESLVKTCVGNVWRCDS